MANHFPARTCPGDEEDLASILAAQASDIYDARTLEELEAIVGRPKLIDLLLRLRIEIEHRLQRAGTDRAVLGRDAHTLLSASGSLGFVELSRSCSEMEQACLRGNDLAAPLENAIRAGSRAVAAIDALCATP